MSGSRVLLRRRLGGVVAAFVCLIFAPAILQATELDVLLDLERQWKAQYAAGRYRDAEAFALQMVALAQRSFSDQPRVVALAFNDLAMTYQDQARYAEAEQMHKRALAMRIQAVGGDAPEVAASQNNLGNVYLAQGRYAEAETLFKQSLATYEKSGNAQLRNVAQLQNNLAGLYKTQGRYADAERLYRLALASREQLLGRDHPDTALTASNFGGMYEMQGRYSEAEPLFKRALDSCERTLGPAHPSTATAQNNLAVLYYDQGRYAEAEPLFKRALETREKSLGAAHPEVALTEGNLANMLVNQGRYAEAEPLFKHALASREKALGPNHPDVAGSLTNLAILYMDEGRDADAEPLFARALAIREKALGPDHALVAAGQNNLAILYKDERRFAEAEPLLKQTLASREKNLGPDHVDVAASLINLANMYVDQGNLADVEPLYVRALEILEKNFGPAHPMVASAQYALANLYSVQKKTAESAERFTRAITILEQAHADPILQFKAYRGRADLRWHAGDREAAIADLRHALDLAEGQRSRGSGSEMDRAQAFAQYAIAYEMMVHWQIEMGNLPEAFATIERSRARALFDQMATAHVDLLAGVPAEKADVLRRQEAEAQQRASSLEKQIQLLASRNDLSAADRQQQRSSLEKDLAVAREALVDAFAAIRSASPAYRQMVGQDYRPAALEDVQAKLVGADGLLLEYYLGNQGAFVFVIPTKGEKPRVEPLALDDAQAKRLNVEAGPLTAERMRRVMSNAGGDGVLQLLRQPDKSDAAIEKLAVLWKVLVPEAEQKLLTDGKTKRLTIVPDGPLALLPFETLVVESGNPPRYLLDAGPPIISAPSTTLLMNLTTAKAAANEKKPVLTVGDPQYVVPGSTSGGDSLSAPARYVTSRGELQALPFSGTESSWVASVFKDQGIEAGSLLQSSAREASVRAYAPGRGLLHFACHGLVDQSYGNLFGALAFTPGPAGAADPNDDGFLTLGEIYGLELQGTQISILSACDTNFGPEQKGEGVWSLSRGFLVAGSKRVVASNWLVDDEAAASLISVFCGVIAKGEGEGQVDYAQALHDAKLWVRQQDKWQSPYFWGTFVLVGPN